MVTSPSVLLSIKPPFLQLRTCLLPPLSNLRASDFKKKPNLRRIRGLKCRAEFSQDAPFAIAIGGCILNSLFFPLPTGPDDDGSSGIDSTDARFAVMGVISFIPYFNWLSWVFAWLDTGSRRYVVYSIFYLAPYLRTNLSLSIEDSWLPIASVVLCIIHIQLEASIRNGDLQGFQLFSEVLNSLSSITRKKDTHFEGHQGIPKKGKKNGHIKLPSAQESLRNEIQGWGVQGKPLDDHQHLTENDDSNQKKKDLD